jgi:hypothetical protein
MDSNISSVRAIAPGLAVPYRAHLRGVYMTSSGGGVVQFRDGSLSGPVLTALEMPAVGAVDVILPGRGVLFPNGIFLDIAGAISSVTLFHG